MVCRSDDFSYYSLFEGPLRSMTPAFTRLTFTTYTGWGKASQMSNHIRQHCPIHWSARTISIYILLIRTLLLPLPLLWLLPQLQHCQGETSTRARGPVAFLCARVLSALTYAPSISRSISSSAACWASNSSSRSGYSSILRVYRGTTAPNTLPRNFVLEFSRAATTWQPLQRRSSLIPFLLSSPVYEKYLRNK